MERIGKATLRTPEDGYLFFMFVYKSQKGVYSARCVDSKPPIGCEMNLWSIVMAAAMRLPRVRLDEKDIPDEDWQKMCLQVGADSI
jgi:hypothetical protein